MNFGKKRALVIDDYATMIRIIARMMNDLEFIRVDGAKDGEEGLCKLRDGKYDVALCDWSMEGISGADVLAAWRREPDLQSTALIMVGNDMQAKAALLGGADGYLCKPFNVHILRDTLTSVFDRRSLALTNGEHK